MRILMISDVFFPRINGVSTSIATFANQFQQQGHEVHLIAPAYSSENLNSENLSETKIFRIPSRVVPFDPEDRLMSKRHVKNLLPTLRVNEYDVLHIHTPFVAHYAGILLARELNIPVSFVGVGEKAEDLIPFNPEEYAQLLFE